MIIISYRASYNRNTACHCHPEHEYGESSLAIQRVGSLEYAADFIANCLWDGEQHTFVHIVFDTPEDFAAYYHGLGSVTAGGEETPYEGTASIVVVNDEYHIRRSELVARVEERLTAYQVERDKKNQQRKAAEAASAKAAQRAADLRLLKELEDRLKERE